MPKKYYAVKAGFNRGIYSYEDAREQVQGYSNAEWKGFNRRQDAVKYLKHGQPQEKSDQPKEKSQPQKREETPSDDSQEPPRYFFGVTAHRQIYLSPKDSKAAERIKAQIRWRAGQVHIYKAEMERKEYDYLQARAMLGIVQTALSEAQDELANLEKYDSAADRGAPEEISYVNEQGKRIFQVFTDGAYKITCGVGVYFGRNNPLNLSEPYGRTILHSNQQAELYAIKRAYEIIFSVCDKNRSYEICTDSAYAIGCLTEWAPTWQQNGWRNNGGFPVKNQEILQDLLRLKSILASRNIRLKKVKAHSDCEGNKQADRLAKEAMMMSEDAYHFSLGR
ncbi:Ribonuclease H [Yarrowia sp. C11]|nr:Ribonuclease H [Yarrowia sp. C11]